MSATNDVVLRCPNCGTTQEAAGECDACHEATVAYYCPNHTPGRWLGGPTCSECALRRRDAAQRSIPAPSSASRGPERTPDRTPDGYGARPPLVPRVETPPFDRVDRPAARGGMSSLDDLLKVIIAARSRGRVPRDRRDEGVPAGRAGEMSPSSPLPKVPGLPSAVGCLKRLAILAVIAAILFALASAWFFSSVFVVSARTTMGVPVYVVGPPDSAHVGRDRNDRTAMTSRVRIGRRAIA